MTYASFQPSKETRRNDRDDQSCCKTKIYDAHDDSKRKRMGTSEFATRNAERSEPWLYAVMIPVDVTAEVGQWFKNQIPKRSLKKGRLYWDHTAASST